MSFKKQESLPCFFFIAVGTWPHTVMDQFALIANMKCSKKHFWTVRTKLCFDFLQPLSMIKNSVNKTYNFSAPQQPSGKKKPQPNRKSNLICKLFLSSSKCCSACKIYNWDQINRIQFNDKKCKAKTVKSLAVFLHPGALEWMTCLNCGCQTRKSELTRRTWLQRHILRLWLHPMLPSSGSLFYLCVCLCVCHCSGFTPGEDRQLLCGGEDAGEGQPISRRATETAPVWSECQHKTGHLLLPPLD